MPKPTSHNGDAVASVSPEEIPTLVAALRSSFNTDKTRTRGWRMAQLNAFEKLLTEGFDEIADSVKKDIGKSAFETFVQEVSLCRHEVHDAKKHLDEWMADEYVTNNVVNVPGSSALKKDPLGVVLVMGAWNYNILLSLQPMIGAIAAGNCVVMKPGSYSENSSAVMEKLVAKYLDQECIRCVTGNRQITSALLDEKFDMIFFTGSPFVGKVIAQAAAKHLTPVVLELGGKSPCIVDKDCDIQVAAKRIAWGALMNCGQTCVRPDYLMVHEQVADHFINQLIKCIREFYGTDPKKSEWFGRIVNDSAFNRLLKCVQGSEDRIVYGGDHDAAQKYISPTVFDFGTNMEAFESSEVMQDEIFGPLMPIFRYSDLDEQVLPFIRARPKPLALYCFTNNKLLSEKILTLTSSGAGVVNDCVVHLSNSNLPFGGVGESGMGSYHGKRSFMAFTHEKAILRKSTMLDIPHRYPPYTNDKQLVMNFAMIPQVPYYFERAVEVLSDKKNLAIGVMGYYILNKFLKSKI